MPDDKKSVPPGMASIFANALASQSNQGRSVGAGMHNTLECKNCGAARRGDDRNAKGPLVCRYCGTALV